MMLSPSATRFVVPAMLMMGLLALSGSGCELIASVDRNKIDGVGAAGAGGSGAGGMPPVCEPSACDALDEECLDFSCNADDTACDNGVAIAEGQPCLVTMGSVCNADGVCIPIECSNGVLDGEETDVDCGGSQCARCGNGLGCNVAGDCASNSCDTSGGNGSGAVMGVCIPCVDADCPAGSYCDDENSEMAEQVCKDKLDNGLPCDAALHETEQCTSDFCADGVCCDTACDAPDCQSCVMASTGQPDGTCALVMGGIDPDDDCTENLGPDMVNGCEGDSCSGTAAACAPAAGGTCRAAAMGCDAPEMCDGLSLGCPVDEIQMPGVDSGMCNGYLCDGNTADCPTACAGDGDCVSATHYCNNNSCIPKEALGTLCSTDGECASGFCSMDDGICCDAPCSGVCENCNMSGICTPFATGTNPGLPPECLGAGEACDGAGVGMSSCKLLNGEVCMNNADCISNNCSTGSPPVCQ